MDIASLLGVILGIGMVLFGIIQNGGVPALLNFLDAPSAIITIGGSLSAVLCSNKLSGFIAGIKSFALPFKEKSVDPGETINKIIELSNVSRKEGLLALEEAAGSIDDEFLKKGIMLVVDGTDAELVRGILETDMLSMEERHRKGKAVGGISKESHSQATGTAHNRICTAGQACGRTPQHVSWA